MSDSDEEERRPVEVPLELPEGFDRDKLDDDMDLVFARNMRLKIAQSLMPNGKVTDDPKILSLMLSNIDGIERSALGRKRIKSDDKTNDVNSKLIGLGASILQSMRGGKSIPPVDITDVKEAISNVPSLPFDQEINNFGPGEKNIGNSNDNFENFMRRTNTKQ